MHFLPLSILELLDALLICVCPFCILVEGLEVNDVVSTKTDIKDDIKGEFLVHLLC